MLARVIDAGFNSFMFIILVFFVGIVVNMVMDLAQGIIKDVIGGRLSNILFNYVTFIGTVHHELSHALFATITGAKVTKIVLYKNDPKTSTLGYIKYYVRGPKLLHGLQHCMSGIAPVVMGLIDLSLLYKVYEDGYIKGFWMIGFCYLMLSIFLHMRLSKADIKLVITGLPLTYLLLFIVFFAFKLNLDFFIGFLGGL